MELIFLTVEDVIFVQSEILSKVSVTDIGKLESAIKRAEQYHHYEDINDIIDLTAIYIIGIAKAHAFPDGNKRTAFLAATYFLDLNGYSLEENNELPTIIEQATSGAIDRHRLVEVLGPYISSDK
jgi:death-on-curing protein